MWYFEKLTAWQVSSAPKHEEFFASDNRSIAHSLVREMTQNSADNPVDRDTPVEVRFRLSAVAPASLRPEYFQGLESHLQCTLPRAASEFRGGGQMHVLTVEDFGTTGLTGAYDDPSDNGNFNSFWRRYGESQKAESKGGRHGVGKSTAASASQIRTVFGLTKRSDDGKLLLYGQAALWPHSLPGEKERRDSYGLFSGAAHPAPPLPYEGQDAASFAAAFGLARGERTGLSLVIPAPVPELTEEAITEAAVENCFHQIVTGELRVVVNNTALSRESIKEVVSRQPTLMGLAESVALSEESTVGGPPELESAKDTRERLAEEELHAEKVAELRERWTAGHTVSMRLWVPVPGKTRGSETLGEAWLYLRRAKSAETAHETYVRGRIIVPERRLMQGKDVLGLMVVRDGPLSQFLGDSEQPSHTRWVMSKLKGLYSAPEWAFRRARHALADFERIVVGSREGEAIRDLLKPFFFAPAERKPTPPDGKGKPDVVIPPPAAAVLDVRGIRGGFVAVRPAGTEPVGRVRIDIRYNVRKGRPKFRREDFDLDSEAIAVECEGTPATVTRHADSGSLIAQNVQAGFRLQVTGFDTNRDIYVHAEAEETDDGA